MSDMKGEVDPYKQQASKVFGVPYEEVTPEQRRYVKVASLYTRYGYEPPQKITSMFGELSQVSAPAPL